MKTIRVPTNRFRILDLLPPGPIVGVEVGTDAGHFACEILKNRPDLFLYTVDPWQTTGNYPEPGRVNAMRAYKERVEVFGRGEHLRMTSVEGAGVLAERSVVLDFIYIDADHDETSLVIDLNAWYPLLRNGGLMAGHDFCERPVHSPVIEFVRNNRHDLGVINERGDQTMSQDKSYLGMDGWRDYARLSWYFFKTPSESVAYGNNPPITREDSRW